MFFAMAQDDHVNSLNCTALNSELTRARCLPSCICSPAADMATGCGRRSLLSRTWPNRAAKWLKDLGFASSPVSRAETGTPSSGNPADHLPPNVMQITAFGERAEFSTDSQRVLFLSKQFGDVMEYTIRSGRIRCLTQHFKHHGFNRVTALSNGDYLLTGPDETFDATNRETRLKARHFAKLFVLDRSLTKPPHHSASSPRRVLPSRGRNSRSPGRTISRASIARPPSPLATLCTRMASQHLVNTRLLLNHEGFPRRSAAEDDRDAELHA